MDEQNERLRRYSKELRKNMTAEEKRLWYDFLSRYPLRFRRQHIIGHYIADFYCHAAKLAVETDGSQHYADAGKEYDSRRDEYFLQQGIAVIRISNLDVKQNFEGVCMYIDRQVFERTGYVSGIFR